MCVYERVWVGIAEIDYRRCNGWTMEGAYKEPVTVDFRLDYKNTTPNKADASAVHVLPRRVLLISTHSQETYRFIPVLQTCVILPQSGWLAKFGELFVVLTLKHIPISKLLPTVPHLALRILPPPSSPSFSVSFS